MTPPGDTELERPVPGPADLAVYKVSTLNPEMYVITRAYSKAEDLLRDLGVVVLVGNPGSGKTTLGEFLKQSINICPVSMLIEYVVTPRVTARGAVNIVVESKHYRFLAQRFTDELKWSEPLVKKYSSMRTILKHPSFKDNDFVKFLTEEFWNNEVPSEILYRKLDAFEIQTDFAFAKETVDNTWEYFQNGDIGDTDRFVDFRISTATINTVATVTSPVSLAIFMKLNSLSSHFVSSLCKADSSEIELQGKEILDVACFVGNTAIVDILLESGIAPTMSSFTALAASQIDELDIFVNLLKHKKDLELSLRDLGSMLFLALEKNNGNISSMLIDEITKMDNCRIILERAIKQLLLQSCRGVKTCYYKPKISSACGARNLFKTLFRYTASLKPEVVVSLTAGLNDAVVLKDILHMNAPWWHTIKGNETLLHMASCYVCVESVTFLIGEGCRICSVDAKHQTALHLAAMCGKHHVVLCLLSKGADPNAQNIYGDSPLHLAAYKGSLDIVKVLTERGARLNAHNADGKTPLHIASQNKAIIMYLQPKGAEINKHDINGRIPFHEAAKGADPNVKNGENVYPLHIAAKKCELILLKALVEKGANLNVTDSDGNTPLYLTVDGNSMECVSKNASTTIPDRNKNGKQLGWCRRDSPRIRWLDSFENQKA
ncbi:ankyrin-3-like [Gigantopelta aegis]|uniref:ankyrin-3-like n=1 Tax=Gigantopelta aegis TaxID=1735272 RepID=UPI001B88E4D6|nr:ankyrin-3-like [Gigantopelta aegis]